MDKVVEIVGGGTVINGAYPVYFTNTSFINSLTESYFVKISSRYLHFQTVRPRELMF